MTAVKNLYPFGRLAGRFKMDPFRVEAFSSSPRMK